MKENLLITFGCSWTYGVGVAYESGMLRPEYGKIAWDEDKCNELSFRGLLSSKFGLDNINFAHGASSNTRQFRLAKQFFMSDEFKVFQTQYKKIIVLWAITSTARGELFSTQENKYINFKYDHDFSDIFPFQKQFITLVYNHDTAVDELMTEMYFFNYFFKSNNIHNVWVDTFNHHNYKPNMLTNLLFDDESSRDLLSKLSTHYKMQNQDTKYHLSSKLSIDYKMQNQDTNSWWTQDSNKIPYLVEHGILNPLSHHPTKQGHIDIANFIEPEIAKFL